MKNKKIIFSLLIILSAFLPVFSMQQDAPCVEFTLPDGRSFTLLKKLDQGTCGKVYLVTDSHGQHVVCKCPSHEGYEEMLKRESNYLLRLKFPGVIPIIGTPIVNGMSSIVMPYVQDGDLYYFVETSFRQNPNVSLEKIYVDQCKIILVQLLLVLHHLHVCGVCHQDVKAENVLVDRQTGIVFLCDFGLAQETNTEHKKHGTIYYLPPEIFQQPLLTCKADMWSLGVLLYCLLHRNYPFNSTIDSKNNRKEHFSEIKHKIVNSSYILREDIDLGLAHIIRMLLQKNPAYRPTAFEVLALPFVQEYLMLFLSHVATLPDIQYKQDMHAAVSRFLGTMEAERKPINDLLVGAVRSILP